MNKYLFLFDLDATITKKEILPEIASLIGNELEMSIMTEQAMNGEIPFEASFRQRVDLLKNISIKEIQQLVSEIPLNTLIVDFITRYSSQCRIITSNLDVWVYKLIIKLGMENNFVSSRGIVKNDRLVFINEIINKGVVTKSLQRPFVAIGDGHNDLPMIIASDIGVGFGGVRSIAPAVQSVADYNIYTEQELCKLLEHIYFRRQ